MLFSCDNELNIIGDDPNANFADTNINIRQLSLPVGHPRLLLKSSDMELIRDNMQSSEASNALLEYDVLLANSFDGNFENKGDNIANYDGKLLSVIESRAFDYIVNGNTMHGQMAISSIKNVFNTVNFSGLSDVSRALGHVIFTASEVYDWCYPLLSSEDKTYIIEQCLLLAAQMEIGWPPVKQGSVTSHAGEAQLMRDLFSFGIAVYDERPEFYDMIMNRYTSEFIQPRNYWYQSHTHHQGSAYGAYRMIWDAWGQWIIYRLLGTKSLHDNFGLAAYNWIYLRRPDTQLFREGDDSFENRTRNVTWGVNDSKAQSRSNTHVSTCLWMIGNFYKDAVLKNEASFYNPENKIFVYTNATRTPVQFFLFNDPSVGKLPANNLSLVKYSPSPYGGMIARTGWNNTPLSNDVVVFMKIGELSGGNHHHQDAGNFQVFYKGILASESGFYDGYGTPHQLNYQKATIAHNSLLIYDPGEVFGPNSKSPQANDGGQNLTLSEANTFSAWLNGPFDRAKVLAYDYSATNTKTDYAYIQGDLTKAYTRKVNKVSEVIRSMMFVPTDNNNFPALFVVFDKITALNKSYKKTFLLHAQEEPILNSSKVISIRNIQFGYNGMLVNQTLLPDDAIVTKIGGTGKSISSNRFFVAGNNYLPKNFESFDETKSEIEFGWGRVEITPGAQRFTDYFLNVMYVKDADMYAPVQVAELIENDLISATKVLGNVIAFAKNNQIDVREFTLDIPGNEEQLNIIVTGVEQGEWSIIADDKEVLSLFASTNGKLLHFQAPANSYLFKRKTTTGLNY